MNIIEIKNLSFSYKKNKCLHNIDLIIKKGTCNLFIGHNGSGKSTIIKLILGLNKLRKKDKGIIKINTPFIAYLPEKMRLPEHIYVADFLNDLASLSPIKCDYNKYLSYFNLNPKLKIGELSKGNRQKVGIIQLLMYDDELLILDEPTDGLDIDSSNLFLKVLKEKINEGKTIIVSTHNKDFFKEIDFSCFKFNNGTIEIQ